MNTANLGWKIYSMFDLLDPFLSHNTQQPLGLDQLSTLYGKAVVIGAKINVKFHNNTTKSFVVGITPMRPHEQSELASAEHYMELNGTKSRLLSPDVDHTEITCAVNTRRWVNVKSLRDAEAWHTTLNTAASPTDDCQWHVWCQVTNTSSPPTEATETMEYVTTLDYLVRVWDPIVPARS